ncbi:MAG TPA: PAS domain S-box protein, partial [Candidatus Manganitrophaceae bacterium]|nr:PAS domain S-box protein [Candidatus Manganitrophaceae bacterium]
LLVENLPDVIMKIDRNGMILFINHTLPEYTVAEVIGSHCSKYLSPEDASRFLALMETMFSSGKPQALQIEAAGPTYWLSRIFPIRRGGKVESALVIATDITEQKRTERALLESNELNRRIVEGVSGGIVQVAIDGAICLANEEAQRVLGLRRDQLTNLYVSDFEAKTIYEDGTVCPVSDYPVSKCLATGKTQAGITLGVRRPDGTTSWAIYSAMPMQDPESGRLSGAVVTFVDISDRKRVEEDLKTSRQQLRDLSIHLQTILEKERTRISREIHDELGQQLTILKMELACLGRRLAGKENSLSERIESMNSLVEMTIKSVRKISTEIRPWVLDDLGLTAAIEWQVEEFKSRTGLQCRFSARPEEITLDPERSTAVFRIFQETLTNIVRHAGADAIVIRLEKRDDHLILEVRDNGRGITEDQIAHSRSLGLLGIRERALLWGGSVQIQGAPGKGTKVSVRIPL